MSKRPAMSGGPLYWMGRRSWRFWIIVTAMVPTLYLLSFGPACFLMMRNRISGELVVQAYGPLIWLKNKGPSPIADFVRWYAKMASTDSEVLGRLRFEEEVSEVDSMAKELYRVRTKKFVNRPAIQPAATPNSN